MSVDGKRVAVVDFDYPIVGGQIPQFFGTPRYSHSALYRAPCRRATSGCRQCGRGVSGGLPYCSIACQRVFELNHFWLDAKAEALRRATPAGCDVPHCQECGDACTVESFWAAAEVHHIKPRWRRKILWFSCCHHLTNLFVACRRCHRTKLHTRKELDERRGNVLTVLKLAVYQERMAIDRTPK